MKHNFQTVIILLIIFFIAQIVGLGVTNAYIDHDTTNQTGNVTYNPLPFNQTVPDVNPTYSFGWIFVLIIIGTILLLVLLKFKLTLLWKLWFFIAVWMTLTYSLSAFIPAMIAAIIGVIVAAWRLFKPNIFIHNFSEIFIYAGIAAVLFRMMNLFSVFILMFLISLYDMYAVWKSKHMVTLAKSMIDSKIFAGLSIPYTPVAKAKSSAKRVTSNASKTHKLKQQTTQIAILGGGDIAFPLIFASVVMKTYALPLALIIPVFATLSLAFLFYISKKGKFYPAMPFISAGCLIGYGIVYLVSLI